MILFGKFWNVYCKDLFNFQHCHTYKMHIAPMSENYKDQIEEIHEVCNNALNQMRGVDLPKVGAVAEL